MGIQFNLVPIDIRVPGAYAEFSNERVNQGLPGMPSRLLLIGQRLAGGAVAAGVPTQILSGDQAAGYFGRGSMLHQMTVSAKTNNDYTECWAIALDDDAAGAAAVGAFTFSGPATAAGTIYLYVGGRRLKVGVASGDSGAALATTAAAAINANLDGPVTAAVDGVNTAKINITARHKGEAGNEIDLRYSYHPGEDLPAGVGVTVSAMSGGTANPDLATALMVMGATWYTDVAMPYTDAANMAALRDELETRSGPLVAMDGFGYANKTGSHSTLSTLGAAHNSQHYSIMGGKAVPTTPWEWAARQAAVAAYYFKIDPVRQLRSLPLKGMLPPAPSDRFTLVERNLLLHNGISTFDVDDGGKVLIERMVTTYQTNAQGFEDESYLDVTTVKGLSYLRFSLRARIAQRFPRHKLAQTIPAGAPDTIVTPAIIRDEIIALGWDWFQAGIIDDMEEFKRTLRVEIDPNDPNRVNVYLSPNVVNNFIIFAAKMAFIR